MERQIVSVSVHTSAYSLLRKIVYRESFTANMHYTANELSVLAPVLEVVSLVSSLQCLKDVY